MSEVFLNCSYASICAGCDWLLKPVAEQCELKLQHFKSVFSAANDLDVGFVSGGVGASRDRVDLTLDRRGGGPSRLGLFDRTRTGLVDLQGCPQLSPSLEAWLQDFRRYEFPIERGSVRLRVAPDGTRGVWLDFANVDVKTLLDDRTVLLALLSAGVVVEIGQRRKRLVDRDGRLRLDDPVLYPWFETYVAGRSIPLYATIGSFTQPGFRVNRLLVDEVMSFLGDANVGLRDRATTTAATPSARTTRAAEFGSGIGNFTLPLSASFDSIDAYEVDALALDGLRRTLSDQNNSNVSIHTGNFQGDKALALDFSKIDLLLVDPPRSGLMKFLEPLASARPREIIYISCFAESFSADSTRLFSLGYTLKRLSLVDQFPQSRHYEIIARFTL